MKSLSIVALLEFSFLCAAFAQGTIQITTDKSFYSHGEPIQVRVSVSNNTDSAFSIWGSSSCIARILFNEVTYTINCTADNQEFRFDPGTTRTWIWNLDPARHGIPDKEGLQTICGLVAGLIDSVHIQAPRYYGGRMRIGVKSGITEPEMQSLRDSVGATVLSSDTLLSRETWEVVGHSIDSICTAYATDYRLKWIYVDRPFNFDSMVVTSVPYNPSTPTGYSLSQNYPNPFNPSTAIEFVLPTAQFVSVRVFDLNGQIVAVLAEGSFSAGTHKIVFDASRLSSGTYFCHLSTAQFEGIRKMVYVR